MRIFLVGLLCLFVCRATFADDLSITMAKGDFAKALVLVDADLVKSPNDLDLLLKRSSILLELFRADDARINFEKIPANSNSKNIDYIYMGWLTYKQSLDSYTKGYPKYLEWKDKCDNFLTILLNDPFPLTPEIIKDARAYLKNNPNPSLNKLLDKVSKGVQSE